MFESVRQDVRFGLRSLAKAPGLTAAVVFTMALGIGANAVVFAVVKTVMINALPYDNPDRLVAIAEAGGDAPNASTVSVATVRDWGASSGSFSRVSLWRDFGITAIESGRADMLRGERVSADFFDTLGIRIGVERLDSSTACAVAALLGAAAMAASYVPLARIDRFDPQATLRGE